MIKRSITHTHLRRMFVISMQTFEMHMIKLTYYTMITAQYIEVNKKKKSIGSQLLELISLNFISLHL